MKTLIAIQDALVDEIESARSRWAHRKDPARPGQPGGHYSRRVGKARTTARRALLRLGFTDDQIKSVIKDAEDVAELNRIAED